MNNFEEVANSVRFDKCNHCEKYYEVNGVTKICNRCRNNFKLLIAYVKKHGTKIIDYYS